MKRLCLLFMLLSVSVVAVAQEGERALESCAMLLMANRTTKPTMFFMPGPTSRVFQADTLTANAGNYTSRAFNYAWQHDYAQAAVWLEKTGNRFPKEGGTVGEIYLSYFHDFPRALRHFEAYDALTPGFDDLINHNPVSYMEGLAWRSLGEDQKAIGLFSRAIDSVALKHGARWVNYKHFVGRAVSYMATKQPEKALADLDSALVNFNRSALAQYHRGRALVQLNRLTEAKTAFQDASFFFKALRAERASGAAEDEFNPLYEEEIDTAIQEFKK